TEHEPGLVAVPDRRDRVHHQVARGAVKHEAVEDADAEVEAVEQDVKEHAEAEDQGPDRHEIDHRGTHGNTSGSPARRAMTGSSGRPASTATESMPGAIGPVRTSRAMTHTPTGKMIR